MLPSRLRSNRAVESGSAMLPMHPSSRLIGSICCCAIPLLLSGCVLAPAEETRQEQAKIDEAGKPYEPPIEQRIPTPPLF